MADLNTAIDQFTNQLAEIGSEAFTGYTGGFQQYLLENQKKISGGFINPNRSQGETMVIYGDDQKAHDADLAEFTEWFCTDQSLGVEFPEDGCYNNITLTVVNAWGAFDGTNFPEIRSYVESVPIPTSVIYLPESLINNISQLMSVDRTVVQIDPDKAAEVLKGRKIHELITRDTTRQDKIDEFFGMYANLKIPNYPEASDSSDEDLDGFDDTWNPGFEDEYSMYGISIEGGDDYITWRNQDADEDNANQTLEWLRDDLDLYFLPGDLSPGDIDGRPKYENKAKGYLKIRNLNHAIIIRNEEGSDIGLTTPTIWVDVGTFPKWQVDGFTITMWVRFLNVTNSGTLFNFGNPLRSDTPKGFMLDTFIRDGKRYVRLVVRDWEGKIRDSHFGSASGRIDTTIADYSVDFLTLDYTEIPVDLKEWYFIVATYDRTINEDVDDDGNPLSVFGMPEIPMEYWNWNCEDTACAAYTSYSGLGAKCKVEIISKNDLLRARGYDTETR